MSSLLEHKRKKYLGEVRRRHAHELQPGKTMMDSVPQEEREAVLLTLGLSDRLADALNEYNDLCRCSESEVATVASGALWHALKQCLTKLRQVDTYAANMMISIIQDESQEIT